MSDTHPIRALRARRLDIVSQVSDTEKKLAKLRAGLANLDAAIILLTPDHPDGIPPRREYRRATYFGRKELPRLVLDALREADGPLSLAEIASYAIKAAGVSESAHSAVMVTLTSVLRGLVKRGTITTQGQTRNRRWLVTPL